MAGVLEFALGLESSNFMRELGVSSRELLSFAGIAEGAHYAIEKMGSAIERGAHLNDLSARTGETVGNLYQLEEAFKRAGLGAEAVGPSILRIRKALSGVNEMGGNTNSIFASLGLDREKLQSESPLDAIQQITGALHKLNINDATGAANGLFGRNGAGDMIQLANNAEDVAVAIAHSKSEAALFAKNAKAFDELGDVMGEIQSHIEGFWAGLASGLAPEIKQIEEMIASIDFTTMGLAVVQAFKDGMVTEIIVQAFTAAFEKVVNIIGGTLGNGSYWAGICQVMLGEFETIISTLATMFLSLGNLLTAAFDTLFQKIYEGIGKIPKVGELVGLKGYKAKSFGENYDDRKNAGADASAMIGNLFHSGAANIAAGIGKQADALKTAYANSGGPNQDKFAATLDGLLSRVPKTAAEESAPNKPGKELGEGKYKPQVTDLEKIGFVFGNGNSGDDSARRTADNTQKAVDQLINLNNTNLKLVGAVIGVNLVNN